MARKWLELAHDKNVYLYPTALYWLCAQYACQEIGVYDNVIGCWYKNHEFSYLTTQGGLIVSGKKMLALFEKDDTLLQKIENNNDKLVPIMLEAALRLSGDLSQTSGTELFSRWEDWLQKFISMMTYSVIGTVMEMEEPLLSNAVESIIKEKLSKDQDKIGEYFQILSSSPRETVAVQEEIELLQLREKQLQKSITKRDVVDHVKKFAWIGFGYNGPAWSDEDIQDRLLFLPNTISEVDALLRKKREARALLIQKQNSIEAELMLNAEEQRLVHTLRTLGFWKFQRKFLNQKAHLLMEDFIEEIAKRNHLSKKQVYMIAPNEMKTVLIKENADPDMLNERIQECIIVFTGINYRVLSGKKAEKTVKEIEDSLYVDPTIQEIHGTTAFAGKAEGIVRRVDESADMSKMNTGDILVSTSTNPQVVPAMQKAGAIVTDSGGITCHAAIVSRELEVPCVIGTKIATKVLKDGDKVSVDATRGIVKKI